MIFRNSFQSNDRRAAYDFADAVVNPVMHCSILTCSKQQASNETHPRRYSSTLEVIRSGFPRFATVQFGAWQTRNNLFRSQSDLRIIESLCLVREWIAEEI